MLIVDDRIVMLAIAFIFVLSVVRVFLGHLVPEDVIFKDKK